MNNAHDDKNQGQKQQKDLGNTDKDLQKSAPGTGQGQRQGQGDPARDGGSKENPTDSRQPRKGDLKDE